MARSLAATLSPLIAAVAFFSLGARASAFDEHGVKGWEVFTTETPGGGGQLKSTGLNGEKTNFPKAVGAPTTAGTAVRNTTIQYWHCAECRKNPGLAGGDKPKDKPKNPPKKDEPKKEDSKKRKEPPNCPTFDPRFYELDENGKVVPKKDAPQHIIKWEPQLPWEGPLPHPKEPPANTESGPKKFGDVVLDPYRDHMWCPRPEKFECGAHYYWWLKNHQCPTETPQSFFDVFRRNSPKGDHLVITGTVVEGQEAMVTALDAKGAVLTGVVIELPDGQKVTTDNNGQARFTVPSGLAALTLAMGSSQATSWIWPKQNNLPTKPAIQLPPVIEHGQKVSIGGVGIPANSQVLIDGIPANVLSASPTGIICEMPAGLEAGPHSVAVIHEGKVLDVQGTDGINLTVSPPKTLIKGQAATFEVLVEGTDKRVDIEVINGSPAVVTLGKDAADGAVVSSGGKRNTAKVVVKAVGAGALSLPCRLRTSF